MIVVILTWLLLLQISINFTGNMAVIGSAIYTSNIASCSWSSYSPPHFFNNASVLRWPFISFGYATLVCMYIYIYGYLIYILCYMCPLLTHKYHVWHCMCSVQCINLMYSVIKVHRTLVWLVLLFCYYVHRLSIYCMYSCRYNYNYRCQSKYQLS